MAIRDYALYNASLAAATNGTYTAASSDYPTILYIGPSYFESYDTWPGVKFIHGFNLAKNTSEDRQLLLDYVPLVCKALEKSNGFFHWELGNEPDLYKVCKLILRHVKFSLRYAYSAFRLRRKVLSDHLPGMKPTTLQNGLILLVRFIILLVRAAHLSILQANIHFTHPPLPAQATVLTLSQLGMMDWIPTTI